MTTAISRNGRRIGHPIGKRTRPPHPRNQVSLRLGEDLIERIEERALELGHRAGTRVSLTDMARMAFKLLLDLPLPPEPLRSPCNVVGTAGGGRTCLECLRSWAPGDIPGRCERTGAAVGATHR